ncbi:efflux transporter outer membrane subunit [Paraburkholderia sp. CNPSo 3157]|uniref:Efflux transporter outer membrane subunit n=1 Tax=Paraburkholderia franconis TaxID=2654983 RepID=A0A7X1NKL2_9BURK|nr:efflux transporter outer membrane subunit [Paraburkholderia franconis]MPW23645.1 efflux transporter outer membrane subunit [Paraburkholderia franconis]
MRPLALTIVAGTLMAAGCTMTPAYQRPTAPTSNLYPTGGVYATRPDHSSGDRSAKERAAVDIGWREFFADPRLQKLVEIALSNNRDLRVAVLNVDADRERYRITRAASFPVIDASAGANVRHAPKDLAVFGQTVSRDYTVGLNTSWEIDFWGRIRSLSGAALAQYLATAQARKSVHIALVAQVADEYLTLLAYDDLLTVTKNTLSTAQASYELTKLQFDTGVGSELNLREAQSVVDHARANLQAQARARAQAENALVLLIGEPLPDDLPLGLSLDAQDLLADVPAGLPSDLLSRRPDIMAAEEQLIAANANIGAARAAFFPRISLTGAFGTASPTLEDLFKAGSAAWSFAPQVALPIFEGGANIANLDRANVLKEIQIANYEKTVQSAFREVTDGLAARGTYDNEIATLRRNQDAQRRRFDLAYARYRNGANSYLSVLAAQNDLYSSEQQLVVTRLARWTSIVDLYHALGGGWLEHSGDKPIAPDATAGYAPNRA